MNRHKLLALAAMLLVPLAACDEGTPPVPTGTIDGQVSIEGQGIDGVTVTLSTGPSTTTASGGRFSFANVDGGTYTVTISNFPADASFTSTSQPATITSAGQTATLNFTGTYIRTASIIGSVTVERAGLSGVTVRLSGMSDASTQTDANGQYAFTQLRAGNYEVELSGFAADVGFSNTSRTVVLDVGETEGISFDGTYVRTAGIQGRVAIEGVGLAGVTVNLSGVGPARTATTDAAGQYVFAELRAGVYQVGISGFSADDYEFATTSQSVTVALGQTANVPFDGTRLRTAGISGQVAVEGIGIGGVVVALSGAAEGTDTTDAQGQYGFSGLAAGTYNVTISGWDAAAYIFDTASKTVVLADDQAAISNFAGAHVATATVMGYAFFDANPQNGELDTGDEDTYGLAGLEVTLAGPGVNETKTALTNDAGMYTFENLKAGNYNVTVSAAALDSAKVDARVTYAGTTSLVALEPGATAVQNLPFRIVTQTITMQAMMGNGKDGKDAKTGAMLPGVGIDFYPTYQAAEAERQQLGKMAVTDTLSGTAKVMFPRASDTGPGGRIDHVVFAKVAQLPHDDLAVSANEILEVSYSPRRLETAAAEAVQVINRRATFQFWVKNHETDIGGDDFMEGWASEVRTSLANDGFQSAKVSNKAGKSTFSDIPAGGLPVTYYIRLAPSSQARAMGESFMGTPEASDAASVETTKKVGKATSTTDIPFLVYEYDGVRLPRDTADLGVLRVKWTTQTLILGVHHERTQVAGYDRNIVDGDMRPHPNAAEHVTLQLQTRDRHGTPQNWYYPATATAGDTSTASPKPHGTTDAGLVIFKHLPTAIDFLVKVNTLDSNKKIYGANEVDTFLGSARQQASRGAHSSGAFGVAGGTGPSVSICPLSQNADRDACSTFAYGYTNGAVRGAVSTATYGPLGNLTIFGADTVKLTIKPLLTLGSPRSQSTYVNKAGSCSALTSAFVADTTTCSTGQYLFTGLEGGRYEITIGSNSSWRGMFARGATDTVSITHRDEAPDTSTTAANATVTYLKTSISGTVVNDQAADMIGAGGDNTVHPRETVQGATLTLLRLKSATDTKGTAVATTKSDATGEFSFTNVLEGYYAVEGASTSSYRLVAKDTKPVSRTPALRTTALTAGRAITSGDSLPYWTYGNRPDTTVLRVQTDADFVVVFRDGVLTGTVTGPDGNDANDDPDPISGLSVFLHKCAVVTLSQANAAQPLETCTTYDGSFERMTTTTNSTGAYRFEGVEEGWYQAYLDLAGRNVNQPSSIALSTEHRVAGIRLVSGRSDSNSFAAVNIVYNN